jgi:hypothetical protein
MAVKIHLFAYALGAVSALSTSEVGVEVKEDPAWNYDNHGEDWSAIGSCGNTYAVSPIAYDFSATST